MKLGSAVGCAVLFAVACSAYGQKTGNSEKDVRDVIDRMVQSWNRHDMKAFAALCAEDADYVDISGTNEKGRAEIERHHTAIHAGRYKDSTLTAAATDVRFLRSDVAVAHVRWEVVYDPGGDKRTAFQTLVLTKEHGKWLIAAAQNTLLSGPPATSAPVSK